MRHAAFVLCAAAFAVGLAAPRPAAAPAEPAAEDTLKHIVPLPVVEVSTARASERTPVTRTVLAREDVERVNWGQDTPMALLAVPGTYAYSDAGNGIGYSYLSIRGFPQRRISVLVNGVPLNDPESNEVFWIDHPDLLASTSEVQVQRGVGSALYGGASVGGSVNLETSPFGESRRIAGLFSYGSFDTQRLMLEFDSGRLEAGWNLYGRYSRIRTSGYRDQSWSRLWSYYFSVRKQTGAHSLRANLYGGPEETHLAYLGVPRPYLDGEVSGDADRDRRYNPITFANERDHFFEPHYELIHSWSPSPRLALTQTFFYFDGDGYYDEQRFGRSLADYRLSPWQTADSTLYPRDHYAQNADGSLVQDPEGRFTVERADLVRRRDVANRHYGWVPRLRIEHARGALTVGGEIRRHDGHHWGEVLSGDGLPPGTPPNHTYYDYHPRTLSAGLFAREEYRLSDPWLVTADLGWRHQGYYMREDQFDGVEFDQSYDFLIPRLGVTFTPGPRWNAFASWSYSSREPAFRDLYDAEGAGSLPLYGTIDVANGVYEDPLITPEKVSDFELGGAWRAADASATLHLFRMDFRDELVYAGQFNTDLGFPILGNAAQSVHQGLELAAQWERELAPRTRLTLAGNGTFSDNHFIEYQEVYGTAPGDTVSYDGNQLSLFPAVLGNLSARLSWRDLTVGAEAQYAGRIYVDNTESRAASIDPRAVVNLTGEWRLPRAGGAAATLALRVFNLFDERYEASGYMDYDAAGAYVPHYLPAATRSLLAELRVAF
jgi:iron complex outermembrane receptor protein